MEIAGILNVTPDSFSDGAVGGEPGVAAAVAAAMRMVDEGAAWIDVGGESTRPGATPIDETTESVRVIPVVRRLSEILYTYPTPPRAVRISVDTYRPVVARGAILAGAAMVNDVAAAREPGMLDLLREFSGTCTDPTESQFHDPVHRRIDLCLMHGYDDFHRTGISPPRDGSDGGHDGGNDADDCANDERIVGEVYEFLERRRDAAILAGIDRERIVLDPGIGFGKTASQNVAILRRIAEFRTLGCRLLVGVSRKRFLARFLPTAGPARRAIRTGASIGVALAIAPYVDFLRVHDVGGTCQALRAMESVGGGA